MRKQLTAFLTELGKLGFVHGSSAELSYTSSRGSVAKISIFFTGNKFKVVCTSGSDHRDHATIGTLDVVQIWPLLPPWLKKELGSPG